MTGSLKLLLMTYQITYAIYSLWLKDNLKNTFTNIAGKRSDRVSEAISKKLDDIKRKVVMLVGKTGDEAEKLANKINKEIDDILDNLRK